MNPPTKPLYNATKTETLTYMCSVYDGERYLHTRRVGKRRVTKTLVFESHRQAAKWINPLGGAA